MIILHRIDQREINIVGCESRLTPAKIQGVADQKKIKDYSVKENKVFSDEWRPKFESFEYLISY
ncbi:hypothetical protein SAMN05444483_10979 [Salegentibacter echinorum]|uniref:Uncharacterized protein n=1 Tax=Salegentibacter echinorum TaxID=1073325 RepID=A0A1M5J1R0_SALEC|nr:hypothetical protein [Salegentibacter echinorum]SHG34496.1 hypothetical protein SAMN05444483_10979 [Salegentibacter echinorum]